MINSVDSIFDEFYRNRDNIEIPLYCIKEELQKYNAIVLYGAGSAGIAFLHYLIDADIKPVCFSDGDTDKHGTTVEKLRVIPPWDITPTYGKNTLVIVTINTDGNRYCKDFKEALKRGGHKGVHQTLEKYGCENLIDYTFFRRCYGLFVNEKYNLPACSDVEMILNNKYNIELAYNLLSDNESRDTFLNILRFRLISDDVVIPIYPEEKMYFEYDLFPKTEEVFIDCGACGGSSLDIFLAENDYSFAKYYGIEPDITNYAKLDQRVSELPADIQNKIKIYNSAVWDKDDTANFFVLHGPGTFQADIGPDVVKTITIDNLLDGERATYIKMNIEGSEISALRGAQKTITTYRPRLAIMGYHRTSDFWEVPLLISSYVPDYRISLRSYMKNVAFTFYAY